MSRYERERRLEKASREGAMAYDAGNWEDANPYRAGSDEWLAWGGGWRYRKREVELSDACD